MRNSIKRENKRTTSGRRLPLAIAALTSVTLLLQGCGKDAYVALPSESAQLAPGTYSVAPKVDLLLVQDDTGSSKPIFGNISNQLKDFLSGLQNQGWDYHLATIPLTNDRPIQQVQASKYDPNWGAQFILPFPGASFSSVDAVSAGAFRFPDAYSDFLTGDRVTSDLNGDEPGLKNLQRMLQDTSMTSTGFLRPDAMLAVVILSTGDDTSDRNFCSGAYASNSVGGAASCDLISVAQNGSHPSIPCGQPGANPSPYCNNYGPSLATYSSYLKAYKGIGNSSQVRLYPVVASQRLIGGGCQGANSFIGSRYKDLAGQLNSQSFDICTAPVSTALTGISANLATVEYSFYTHFLFMNKEPDPATIRVYRNPGGDASQRVLINEDSANGWTFVGNIPEQATTSIGSPQNPLVLNRGSGWAVQLHGSEILSGRDTATIEFTEANVHSSGG